MIEVKDLDLKAAIEIGHLEFIQVFTNRYLQVMNNEMNSETMSLLNGEQNTLLAYMIFREEINTGGFCQLIQNGYGAYIFNNPFAKVMRLWGAKEFSKLIYAAKKIYDENTEDLERERTDEEFMTMYEKYEEFDQYEEEFFFIENDINDIIACYIDDNIELFAKIV